MRLIDQLQTQLDRVFGPGYTAREVDGGVVCIGYLDPSTGSGFVCGEWTAGEAAQALGLLRQEPDGAGADEQGDAKVFSRLPAFAR